MDKYGVKSTCDALRTKLLNYINIRIVYSIEMCYAEFTLG